MPVIDRCASLLRRQCRSVRAFGRVGVTRVRAGTDVGLHGTIGVAQSPSSRRFHDGGTSLQSLRPMPGLPCRREQTDVRRHRGARRSAGCRGGGSGSISWQPFCRASTGTTHHPDPCGSSPRSHLLPSERARRVASTRQRARRAAGGPCPLRELGQRRLHPLRRLRSAHLAVGRVPLPGEDASRRGSEARRPLDTATRGGP